MQNNQDITDLKGLSGLVETQNFASLHQIKFDLYNKPVYLCAREMN
jgi:hypothetical protein